MGFMGLTTHWKKICLSWASLVDRYGPYFLFGPIPIVELRMGNSTVVKSTSELFFSKITGIFFLVIELVIKIREVSNTTKEI
jgi:hypothetical protein